MNKCYFSLLYTIDYAVCGFVFSKDNPDVRVIFVVRNPVDRLYSQYKSSYRAYAKFGNFDDFIMEAFDKEKKFAQLREMLTNGSSREAITEAFYRRSFSGKAALGALIANSIYYPPIAHYTSILGSDKVLVQMGQQLSLHKFCMATHSCY